MMKRRGEIGRNYNVSLLDDFEAHAMKPPPALPPLYGL
jgi:hypothetical protein